MKGRHESGEGCARRTRGRYLLALVLAVVMGLVAALPVFAAEDGGTTEEGAAPPEGAEEGGTVEPQVVGGEPVPTGTFSFMVSIQADRSDARPYREHFCGGSLIDENSVLTAAHCADLISRVNSPNTVSFRDVRIAIGLTELNGRQGVARRISSLSNVRIHPLYNGARSSKYDAAVINLATPVDLQPLLLAKEGNNGLERPGRTAVVAGWGNTIRQGPNFSQPDRFPNRMHRAYPPIVSDARGEKIYGISYVPRLMVSAGKPGVDTCQGDSGGPMWRTTDAGRRQIGITSFGAGCGARGFPGVYAEVNNPGIRNFIENAAFN